MASARVYYADAVSHTVIYVFNHSNNIIIAVGPPAFPAGTRHSQGSRPTSQGGITSAVVFLHYIL